MRELQMLTGLLRAFGNLPGAPGRWVIWLLARDVHQIFL
jgi:hypothetical protein